MIRESQAAERRENQGSECLEFACVELQFVISKGLHPPTSIKEIEGWKTKGG